MGKATIGNSRKQKCPVCRILQREVPGRVQQSAGTGAGSVAAAAGTFSEVLWFKGLVYRTQLLCPVIERVISPHPTLRILSFLPM